MVQLHPRRPSTITHRTPVRLGRIRGTQQHHPGEVAERPNASALKAGDRKVRGTARSVGSNPTLSSIQAAGSASHIQGGASTVSVVRQ